MLVLMSNRKENLIVLISGFVCFTFLNEWMEDINVCLGRVMKGKVETKT